MLEMGMSWMWICMRVGSLGAYRERQRGREISRRRERDQRLRESDRSQLMAIFALTEYAAERR